MPVATLQLFDIFALDIARANHNFPVDNFKFALTNTAPDYAADTAITDIVQIGTGTGYATGGNAAAVSYCNQTAGVWTVEFSSPTPWTGTGAGMGPLRYAILWNSTMDILIGGLDYGSSITVSAGQVFALATSGPVISITV